MSVRPRSRQVGLPLGRVTVVRGTDDVDRCPEVIGARDDDPDVGPTGRLSVGVWHREAIVTSTAARMTASSPYPRTRTGRPPR